MRTMIRRALPAMLLATLVGCTSAVPASSPGASGLPATPPGGSPAASLTPAASSAAPGTTAPAPTPSAAVATPSPAATSTPRPTPSQSLLPGAIAIDAPRWPMLVIAGDDAIWGTVYHATERHIARIDPATNAVTTVVGPLPVAQLASVGVGGAVWVADWDKSTLTGYDVETGDQVAELPVGTNPIEPVVAFGDVWTLDHHGGTVTRIDTETRTVEATIKVSEPGERGPNGAAVGGGLLWVVSPNTPVVVAIDPETNSVAQRIRLERPRCASGVAYVADRVWVRECDISRVHVFDPRSGKRLGDVDAIEVPRDIGGDPWIVARLPRQRTIGLAKVDPASLEITDSFETGLPEPHLFVAFDSLWIVAGPRVSRLPLAEVTGGD